MSGRRYARACYRWGAWYVAIHDECGWCYMCEWNEERNDWVTCVFDTEEEAEEEAKRYTEAWNN